MESETLERSIAMLRDSQLIALRKISDTEFEKYKIYRDIVLDFEKRHQLFEGIDLNFNNYVNYLHSILEEHSTKHMMSSFEEISFNSNVLISNFLSSCKAFVDHSDKFLINKFGGKSEEFKKLESFRNQEFDSKFSYKFLSKFRNYCQHCGMPNLHFSINVKSQPDGRREYSIGMSLVSEDLLKKFDWGRIVKQAISLQPKEFDIYHLIFDYYESLKSVYIVLVKIFDFDKVLESKSYINSLFQISDEEGTPCIVTGSFSSRTLEIDVEQIPINIIRKIEMVETWLKK